MRVEFSQVVVSRAEQAQIEAAAGVPLDEVSDQVVLAQREQCSKLACALFAYYRYEGPVSGQKVPLKQLEVKVTSSCPLSDTCPDPSRVQAFRQALADSLVAYVIQPPADC